jgi:hypothetical protein
MSELQRATAFYFIAMSQYFHRETEKIDKIFSQDSKAGSSEYYLDTLVIIFTT